MWVGSRHLYLKDLTQLFSIVMQLWQFIVVVYQEKKPNQIYETFFFSITWNLFNSLLDYYSILSTEKHGLEALLTLKIWNYLYFGHLCLIMFSYWSCCIFSLVIFFFENIFFSNLTVHICFFFFKNDFPAFHVLSGFNLVKSR